MTEKKKKKIPLKSTLCYCAFIAVIVIMIAYIILAYSGLVRIVDSENELRDGLYRLLDENIPEAMRIILPQWAGIVWFVLDCFFFLVLIYFLDKLLIKAKKYMYGD